MKRAIAVLLLMTMLLGILIATGCARRRPVDTVAALAQLELAIKYLSEDNFEQAILAFHAVLEIDPKNIDAYKGLAGAYVMQGEPVKAQEILQQGLAEVAEPAELNLVLAGVLLDAGETVEAEELLKELTAAMPIKLSAYRAYTGMLLEQNRSEEALQLLQRATAEDEVPYQIFTMLAQIHIMNNDTEAALAAIRQSLLINSEQAEAYRQLTQVFQDEPDELIAWGIEQHERLMTELANLIAQYIKGEYTEITAAFAQLSEGTRANAWATIILSKAHLRLGENEESLRVLNTIDNERITCAVLLAEIATQYFTLGETEKAIELAKQGIKIDNTVADNYIVLYRIFRDTDAAQARIWLKKQLIHSTYGFIAASELQLALILAVEPGTEIVLEPETELVVDESLKEIIVSIPDDALETPIREAINKPTGEITAYDMTHMRELEAREMGIVDLTGLKYAVNLNKLDVSNDGGAETPNQISDISVLGSLTNLTSLALGFNQISDISSLGVLTKLNILHLDYNQISDISTLGALTNLTWLGLTGNQINDISVLGALTNLTQLALWDNQISDISALDVLTNLTFLELGRNQINDISVLGALTNLTWLALWDNQINDISVLGALTNLTWLGLWGNQISDISPLGALTNLTRLHIGSNQISDISATGRLTKLTELGFSWNQIRDISGLGTLTNLTSLDLWNNKVSDISALAALANLTELQLSNNPLSAESKALVETLRERGVNVSY